MDEFPRRALGAAIGYVRARLLALATPEKLAELLGVALPADPSAVKTAIDRALTEADAAVAAVEANDVESGAARAWAAVQGFLEAAALLGVDAKKAVGLAVGKVQPGALVAQLGLPLPTASAGAGGVELVWAKSDVTVALFRVGELRLVVALSGDGLRMTVRAGRTRIDLGAGTSDIVRSIIGSAGSAAADLELTVDRRGLTTGGGLGPIALPARLDAQVVDLEGLDLRLDPRGDKISVTVRSRIAADIGGVIGARVDGAGVRLTLDAGRMLRGEPPFGEGAAALEPVAPNGIGLSLTAGPASGSGYLTEVPDGFGGVLDLQLGPVKVTAFGVFQADAQGGISFVAVMSVRFPVPIELGFLFTLNAVGGIVGLGVTVNPDAISAGLKDGVLDRLLFPDDVRKAAPKILQTLLTVFPRRSGGFVVGPMVRLAWGRPVSLVTLDVAVILAVPDPVIIVLGRARAAIPTEQAAIIDLRAGVMAQIGRGIVLMRAELFSSRIGFISVYGGIGMLVRYEGEQTVVISAGGFHPTYTRKPPELADLSRIGAEMSPPVGLQMRVQGYVAMTPNTVQFGGSVEVAYSLVVAAVRASLTLDALIQFDPFGFVIDTTASAHVEAFGISLVGVSLSLHLEGPNPWRVSGTGKVTLPWPLPDPSLSFGPIQIGDAAPADPAPPAVSPLAEIVTTMKKPEAWRRVDRQRQRVPVRLAPLAGAPSELVIEPWGLVQVSQKAFPLEMTIERHGTAPVTPAGCRVVLSGPVTIGGAAEADHSATLESFPVGQLMQLTKDEQLAAPEFEERQGGIAIDPAGAETTAAKLLPFARSATMEYEDSWYERPDDAPLPGALFDLADWAHLLLAAGPAGAGALRVQDRYLAEPPRTITVRAVSEVQVTDVDTGDRLTAFAPWSDASHAARSVHGGVAAMTGVAS